MSIKVNDSGTLRSIKKIFINDNGVLRSIKKMFINDTGTLREIFSSIKFPHLQLSATFSQAVHTDAARNNNTFNTGAVDDTYIKIYSDIEVDFVATSVDFTKASVTVTNVGDVVYSGGTATSSNTIEVEFIGSNEDDLTTVQGTLNGKPINVTVGSFDFN